MKKSLAIGLASLLWGTVRAEVSDNDGFKAGSDNTIVAGGRSLAVGWLNAPSEGSAAIGSENIIGSFSFAVGSDNSIGVNSVNSGSVGSDNSISQSDSTFIFGQSNSASFQEFSLLGGKENLVLHSIGKSGNSNILLGINNTIDGSVTNAPVMIEASILLGEDNFTSESGAWVLGKGNIGQAGTVTVGQYAAAVSESAFIIGNGASVNDRSNALVVLRNGNVIIPEGSLSLGNEEVLTQAATENLISGHLQTNHYLTKTMGLNASTSSDAYLALGENALAQAPGSIAIGWGSTVFENGDDSIAMLSGVIGAPYSFAVAGQAYGTFAVATMNGFAFTNSSIAMGGYDTMHSNFPGNITYGENAVAIGGVGNTAEGFSSFSSGFWNRSFSSYSVALGSLNRGEGVSDTDWVETDPLFELGNGNAPRAATEPNSSNRSNAITTLKNGKTTLENKYWEESDPLAIPSGTASIDSGREALVVKGNTRLRGRVIMEVPQGDILMGEFGEPNSEE
ncbi:MAG: hypothetical protein QM627_01760 [Luteolibacter sp.]